MKNSVARQALIIVALANLSCINAVAGERSNIRPGSIEYFKDAGSRGVIAYFRANDAKAKCDHLDASSLTVNPASLASSQSFVMADAYRPDLGEYIIWTANMDGSHDVFEATYEATGCRIVENRRDLKSFVGNDRFEAAKFYYLKLQSQPSPASRSEIHD